MCHIAPESTFGARIANVTIRGSAGNPPSQPLRKSQKSGVVQRLFWAVSIP